MATPVEKTVTLRTYGYDYHSVSSPPRNLTEAIAILQEALMEIPSEYRASAEVDFSPYWEHGETYDRVGITYSRMETHEEAEVRERTERQAALEWIKKEEALIRRRKAELGI
jgi:hypothetical protein